MPNSQAQYPQSNRGPMHLIEVPCNCPDAEHCDLEKYISDVRILHAELKRARVIYAEYPGSDPT